MKIPQSLFVAFAGLQLAQFAGAAETIVSPYNLNGWVFGNDGAPMGTASFVEGPGTAPAGAGSIELTVADAIERLSLATGAHAGLRLDSLSALGYSTWLASPAAGTASVSLQLDIDYDLSDTTASWQGTLVFEPSLNGTVTSGSWQPWDALAGKWYMTGIPVVANVPAVQLFPLATPGTLTEILAAFPNAGVRATVGSLSLKTGGILGAATINLDALTITQTAGDSTAYNFEPDSDGDGVPDGEDGNEDSDVRPKVDVGMGPTTIDNTVDADGRTIQDLVNQAQLAATNHGKYVSAIAKLANSLKKAKTITNEQSKEMKTGAAHSTIGKPPTSSGGTGTGTGTGTGGTGNGNGNNGNGNGNGNNGNGNGNGNGSNK